RSLPREHPLRTLTRLAWSRAGCVENVDVLHTTASSVWRRCQWFVSPSNKTLAREPFPSRRVGRFPEAPISRATRKTGLSDGERPHIERLRAALVDEPMAQLHWLRKTDDRSYSAQHNAGVVGHKPDG